MRSCAAKDAWRLDAQLPVDVDTQLAVCIIVPLAAFSAARAPSVGRASKLSHAQQWGCNNPTRILIVARLPDFRRSAHCECGLNFNGKQDQLVSQLIGNVPAVCAAVPQYASWHMPGRLAPSLHRTMLNACASMGRFAEIYRSHSKIELAATCIRGRNPLPADTTGRTWAQFTQAPLAGSTNAHNSGQTLLRVHAGC